MENSGYGRDYNSDIRFKRRMYGEASKKLKVLLVVYALTAIVKFLGILDIVSLVCSIVAIVMLFKLGENSDCFKAAAKLTIASAVVVVALGLIGAAEASVGMAIFTLVVSVALAALICWKEFDGMADLVEEVDSGLHKKWKAYKFIYIACFTLASVGATLVMVHMIYNAKTITDLTQVAKNVNAIGIIMNVIALLIEVVKCALIFMEIRALESYSQNVSEE